MSFSRSFGALLLVAPALASAQKLDRTVEPPPTAPKALHVPTWTHTTLANGAELVVTPKKDLPLVTFTINFVGGANQYEAPGKAGVAGMTAQMLREGTSTKTGDQLSDAFELLGVGGFGSGVGSESGSVGFTATKAQFVPTLALLADVIEHPSFPADAVERLRGQSLVNLVQGKDQPTVIASNVFSRTLYGAEHPYGRTETEESIKSITRDDIVAFHKAYYTPGHAVISVAGDVDAGAVKAQVEKALADWKGTGGRPSFSYPAVPARSATAI